MKRLIASFLSDCKGNSVVGAIANIAFATLITLSVLSLSLSAYNTLLIRDAAIEAAARAALPLSPSQQPFLRRLLDDRLPMLASFEIQQIDRAETIGFRVMSTQPALGLIQIFPKVTEVMVAKEQLSSKQ
jgi:hypothetical protein